MMYEPRIEEVRTLFVSGLPEDVKEREIHNLFRLVPGYEGCKLAASGSRPVAFASFIDRTSALAGQTYLQGIKFDPESPIVLRIEFAKSNSKTKRLIDHDDPYYSKRFKTNAYYAPMPYGYSYPVPMPTNAHGARMPSPPRMPVMSDLYDTQESYPMSNPGRPPCSTLFVANLDPTITETDLVQIFGSYPGYKRLRLPMREARGRRNAFVEYIDIQTATTAIYSLQGYILGSSPLHIEFAKAPMGEQSRHIQQTSTEHEDNNNNNND